MILQHEDKFPDFVSFLSVMTSIAGEIETDQAF